MQNDMTERGTQDGTQSSYLTQRPKPMAVGSPTWSPRCVDCTVTPRAYVVLKADHLPKWVGSIKMVLKL